MMPLPVLRHETPWGMIHMKKLALLLAVAVAATAPSAAFAAKKKAAAKPAAAAPADPNAAGKKFVREMWMQPVYAWQAATKKAEPAKPAKKAAKKKGGKKKA
jgi:hypothetical protein